jgi:hypothetical protein
MDETNLNARPKRARVLRATDVIPPFDKDIEPTGDGRTPGERLERVSAKPDDGAPGGRGGPVAARSAHDTPERAESPAVVATIPHYDLAANILAEQRRVASRRRRAPSQPDDEPAAAAPSVARVSVVEFPPQDLTELQRIVAEIVARDIDRLCRQSNRPLGA